MASVAEVVEGLEILAKTARVPAGLAEQGKTDTRTAQLNGAGHDIICGPDADPSDGSLELLARFAAEQFSTPAGFCWRMGEVLSGFGKAIVNVSHGDSTSTWVGP